MKLGLGTAQFGQVYGVANAGEAVTDDVASAILAFAARHDIDLVDTAADYGSCETMLGRLGIDAFSVVTKLPGLPVDVKDVSAWVSDCVGRSQQRLGVESLYGLLLHRPGELLDGKGEALYEALAREKKAGRIGKFGVSVYSPGELETITRRFHVDLVQLPCNVLDRRFLDSGCLDMLSAANVEIHVRSAFLQGLLLMNQLPDYFDRWREVFRTWHSWLTDNGVDPVDACLTFLKTLPGVDRIVVGATSVAQLEHITTSFYKSADYRLPDIGSPDEALVNPSKWVLA